MRFAKFNEFYYKRTLGPTKHVRVFTSDLVPYWNMKVQDAAKRSGYRLVENSNVDTFFIFIFLPQDARELTPATWGEVLRHLPDWLNEPQP